MRLAFSDDDIIPESRPVSQLNCAYIFCCAKDTIQYGVTFLEIHGRMDNHMARRRIRESNCDNKFSNLFGNESDPSLKNVHPTNDSKGFAQRFDCCNSTDSLCLLTHRKSSRDLRISLSIRLSEEQLMPA